MSTLVILGAFSASTVSCLLLYKLIRSRSSSPLLSTVKVNCWFCNAFHVVPRGNRNCWDCPTCDQFNGFDETGDYIKPIPAQYDEYLNANARPARIINRTTTTQQSTANGLCANCNRNQVLKITQLASFVPIFEDHYEDEIEAYKRHLESTYSLCVPCQSILRRKLNSQDASLLAGVRSWRQQESIKSRSKKTQSHSQPLHRGNWFPSLFNLPIKAQLLRFLSLTIATLLLITTSSSSLWTKRYFSDVSTLILPFWTELEHHIELVKHNCQLLAMIGFFCLIVSIFASGREKLRLIDAINCFTWLALLFSHSLPVVTLFTHFWLQFLFSFVCLSLTLHGSFCNRPLVNGSLSWRHYNRLNVSSDCSVDDGLQSSSSTRNDFEDDCSVSDYGSVLDAIQDGLITTTTTTNKSPPAIPAKARIDLDDGLQALKIGTLRKSPNSGIFTPRSYNQRPHPPVFTMATPSVASYPDHQQNLADFQLQWRLRRSSFNQRAPTHSSWVSGGYFSKTSRSFGGMEARSTWFRTGVSGAQSYSCPVSRAGSVLCDDRLSVISDPGGAGREGGSSTGRRGILLSECKFNPFGSNSNTYVAAGSSVSSRENDLGRFNSFDEHRSSSSSVDEKEDDDDDTGDQNNIAERRKIINANLTGSWKRIALYAAFLTSLVINALLLMHLLS